MKVKNKEPEWPIVLNSDDRFVLVKFEDIDEDGSYYAQIHNLDFDTAGMALESLKEALVWAAIERVIGTKVAAMGELSFGERSR